MAHRITPLRSHARAIAWASYLFVGAAATMTSGQSRVDPAGWTPPDAIVFVGIADFDRAAQAVGALSLAIFGGQGITGNAERDGGWLASWQKQLRERMARALECKPEELKNPFDSRLSISLVRGASPAPAPVCIIGVRDEALMREYLDKAMVNFARIARHERISAGADTIECFSTVENSVAGASIAVPVPSPETLVALLETGLHGLLTSGEFPSKIALCLSEQRLILSDSPDAVRAVLAVRASGSLLGDAEYAGAMKPLAGDAALRLYVNVPHALRWAESVHERGAQELSSLIGGPSLRCIAAAVMGSTAEFDSKLEVVIRMSGERSGLAKILTAANQSTRRCAADCALFAQLDQNPADILDALNNALARIDPERAAKMRSDLGAWPLTPKFSLDLRQDLIAELRAPVCVSLRFDTPIAPGSTRAVASIGHRAPARLRQTLANVRQAIGLDPAATAIWPGANTHVAVTDDAIQLGDPADFSSLSQSSTVVTGPTDQEFSRAQGLVPAERWGFLYLNGRRLAQAAVEFSQRESAVLAGLPSHPMDAVGLQAARWYAGDVEISKIPDARRWIAAQPTTVTAFSALDDGVRITRVTLRRQDPQ